jgi:hypothetical protein
MVHSPNNISNNSIEENEEEEEGGWGKGREKSKKRTSIRNCVGFYLLCRFKQFFKIIPRRLQQ